MEIANEDWDRIQAENRALHDRVAALQALREVARALSLELNLRPLLGLIMDAATDLVQAMACTLLLHDRERRELVFDMVTGGGGLTLQERRMPDDSGVPGWVVANQLPLIVNDAQHDPRVRRDIADSVDYSVRSILAVPLMARGKLVGVLEVLNKRSGEDFTGEDLELLSALASQAAIAIENARLYADLRAQRDRLIDAEELVRKQLQEDLHDGLAQELSSMAMKANAIARRLAHESGTVGVELAVLEDDLRSAVRVVRNLLFDLRPLVLEAQGLVPALETYVERVRTENGPALHLDLAGFSGRLDRRTEVNVFGVVQEGLTNIIKHAEARNVWISLAGGRDGFQLTIRDDGRGFDPGQVGDHYEQRGSYGLLNMQERANHIGGKLKISSEPGAGTTVTLTVKPDVGSEARTD